MVDHLTVNQGVGGSSPPGRAFLQDVVQPGRTLGSDPRGRWFKPSHPDYFKWACGSTGECCVRTAEMRVQFPPGPPYFVLLLRKGACRPVGGYLNGIQATGVQLPPGPLPQESCSYGFLCQGGGGIKSSLDFLLNVNLFCRPARVARIMTGFPLTRNLMIAFGYAPARPGTFVNANITQWQSATLPRLMLRVRVPLFALWETLGSTPSRCVGLNAPSDSSTLEHP